VHPDGLANASGTVGKYFMEHPNVVVQGELDTPTGVNQIGFGTRESYQFYDYEQYPPGSFRIAFRNKTGPTLTDLALNQRDPVRTAYETVRDPGGILNAETRDEYQWRAKWGDELLEDIRERYGNHFTILAEIEVLPYAENRVTLDEDQTDPYGNPIPDVDWGYSGEHERETAERAREVLESIVEQLDVGVKWSRTFESWSGIGHAAGTTRMGDDPATSVVDRNLQAHDVENLHVAGASTFVTQGANQPTLTIAALSLRLSEHLDRVVL
jgi:choline dehydrogenase-like flavoprotein